MKRQKFDYENLDLSRWHILNYHEQLLVNGGTTGGSDSTESTSQSESAEDTTENEASSVAEESNSASETATETTTSESGASTTAGGSAPAVAEEETHTGGHEIENTIEAVANAEPGDTLTRDDGTQVTITQGDINWAQEHCDNDGKNEGKDEAAGKTDENATAKDADSLTDSQNGGNSEQSSSSKEGELGEGKSNGGDKTASGENKTSSDKDAAANAGSKKENSESEKSLQKEDTLSAKKNGELNSPKESKSNVNNQTLEKFPTFDLNLEPVKDKYGNFLGYGYDAEARKSALEKTPELNVSLYASGNLGLAQGSIGVTVTKDYGGQSVSPVGSVDTGIYTPGISLNATIGFSFPENEGIQSHTLGLNVFGFGGDVSFSENGITGFNIGFSSTPGYKGDVELSDFGASYNLWKY